MKTGRLPRKHKKALLTGRFFLKNKIDWIYLSIQEKEYLLSLIGKKRYSCGIKIN